MHCGPGQVCDSPAEHTALLKQQGPNSGNPGQSSLIQPRFSVQIAFLSSFSVQSSPVWTIVVLRFFKQLEVQSDYDLSCGDLVEQQPLCDWSFRALVLFYFSQPDLRPAEEVLRWRDSDGEWGENVEENNFRQKLNVRMLLTVRWELVSLKNSDTENILFQVLYKKLTIGVPLRIQCVL